MTEREAAEIPEKVAKKRKKGCLISVLIALGLLVLFVLILKHLMLPVNITRFSAEQIKALEREYNFDLSTAEPERYYVPAMAQDTHDCFNFSVDDCQDFMDSCYFGEFLIYPSYQNADDYPVQYRCRPYPDSEDSREQRFTFLITFEKDGERYSARLVSYYE